ncbi:MAG: preprotein translocase subunit SecE [Elusimicrobia bacterium]|nr:preprotein translocase subunit SecE [Elusimicrobiota bacterium]MBU2614176.1 preprotein translocase subunit SecE [Elusimicrobiota bacterium]
MGIYKKAIQFLKEVYGELKKVSWLSRKEVIATTIVVIIFMLITAAFVGVVDFTLSKLLGIFLGGR